MLPINDWGVDCIGPLGGNLDEVTGDAVEDE